MPQVSKKKIDPFIEKEMKRQFWISIAKISDTQGAYEFFSDLLTDNEEIMLSKRIACAILLVRRKSPVDIHNSINLSFTTIATVSAWVKNAKPKTKKILLAFSKEKDWQVIMDKIDDFLDDFQPLPYTDWKRAGKEKFKLIINRNKRRILR